MNILIAPDSFKGSIKAKEFCDITEKAILSVMPSANVIKVPLADGGEGTIEALVSNTNGEIKKEVVTDPIGGKVNARYGILGDGKTAVIEMATASGLPLVSEDKRNPMNTTTYGTGELVLKALDEGCKKIIMGIGGSATNDGGAGMAKALGFKLLDENKNPIKEGAKGLLSLESIDTTSKDKRLEGVEFQVACDVNNPLCGENGASFVYGPQKGATKEELPILDKALYNFSKVVKKDLGKEVLDVEGSGAAGGLGAGILAFLDGKLKPGFEIIKEVTKLKSIFKENDIDLVITGEGEMNYQTVNGKLPVGVSSISKENDVSVMAIVGSKGEGYEKVYKKGIDSVISIIDKPMDIDNAMENGKDLLYDCVKNQFKLIKSLNCLY
ncbi:MAG: glycerate kinase [Firmicutes bacterium]|nr:glycerate kinase [Bacillota bacterium]